MLQKDMDGKMKISSKLVYVYQNGIHIMKYKMKIMKNQFFSCLLGGK